MFRSNRSWMIGTLSFILFVTYSNGLWGQDGPLEASEPDQDEVAALSVSPEIEGYIGEITSADVNIRSGPAQVYYRVAKLQKGRRVIVRKELFDLWAKVEPTPECFSYISKDFVELRGNAEFLTDSSPSAVMTEDAGMGFTEKLAQHPVRGIVTGENVRVRAGSIGSVKPANADEVQVKLSKGAEVLILGQRDDYYKIVPPENCYFWVSKQFIRNIAAATQADLDLLRLRTNRTGIVAPSGEMPMLAAGDGVVDPGELSGPEKIVYRQAEELFREQLAKPLADRDYKPVNVKIEYLIKNTESSSVLAASEMLKQQVQRSELALAAWNRSKQQNETFNGVLARIREKVELLVTVNDPPQKKEEEIVVQGRVEESAIFTSPNKNRRYLILDDQDKIIFYAVSGKENLDLSDWLEKRVSLIGTAKYDAFSKSRLLYTTHIVELPGETEVQKTN